MKTHIPFRCIDREINIVIAINKSNMNARRLKEIISDYGLGEVKLEKFYHDSNQTDIYVELSQFAKDKGITEIKCNGNDGGAEIKSEINDEVFKTYDIWELKIYNDIWIRNSEKENAIVLDSHIKLFDDPAINEIDLYTKKAIEMSLNPLQHSRILRERELNENDIFTNKHLKTLNDLGMNCICNTFINPMKDTQDIEADSQGIIIFTNKKKVDYHLYIYQNIFDGFFYATINKRYRNLLVTHPYFIEDYGVGEDYVCYEYKINDLTTKEFKNYMEYIINEI